MTQFTNYFFLSLVLYLRSISRNLIEWGTGILDESELALFIQSYLVMLLACSSSLPSTGKTHALSKGEQLLAFVSATAHNVARQVIKESFSAVSKSGRRSVDFQTFGDWYNQGGFRSVPWLELIDLSKWAYLPSPGKATGLEWSVSEEEGSDDNSGYNYENDGDSEEEELSALSSGVRALEESNEDVTDGGISGTAPSFLVVLHKDAGDSAVSIASNVARDFIKFVSYSGLSSCSADTLWAALSQASVDGLISRSAFHSVMKRFIAALTTVSSDKAFVNIEEQAVGYLDPLFSAFDRTNSELADVVELCCGACLLCCGLVNKYYHFLFHQSNIFFETLYSSKSSKLAFAFDLIDDDNDGLLRRRGLWRFFRSLLCALLVLTGTACQDPPYKASRLADPAALWISDAILEYAVGADGVKGRGSEMDHASFDHLADWYSSSGYQLSPWLELLDLSKWQYLVTSSN